MKLFFLKEFGNITGIVNRIFQRSGLVVTISDYQGIAGLFRLIETGLWNQLNTSLRLTVKKGAEDQS